MGEDINKGSEKEKESILDKAKEWADKARTFLRMLQKSSKKVILLKKPKHFWMRLKITSKTKSMNLNKVA